MTLLLSSHVPGLYVEDHSVSVPVDWRGVDPHDQKQVDAAISKGSLSFFYRVVTSPANQNRDDLPLLVFFQGGPGGKSPRPLNPSSDGWIGEAIKHFRVILPDQRGTGRSSAVTPRVIERIGAEGFEGVTGARGQADYLHRFFADSIVRDMEYMRVHEFGGRRWVSEGQSYGGFITLSYLSTFPEAFVACFTTGGIASLPADADTLYAHTFNKLMMKMRIFYDRYPQDKKILADIADRFSQGDVRLPNGDPATVERLQNLGSGFGMKPGFERVHWLLDDAFDGDGHLTPGFLQGLQTMTGSAGDELYWTLQEGIYQDGGESGTTTPTNWAAQRECRRHPQMSTDARPLMLTGEMAFPWMFEQDSALRPFRAAEELLQEDSHWSKVYDLDRLAANTVPVQAAVYQEDMYVPCELSLKTLEGLGSSHAWVTNEFQHDGVHGDVVFRHLLREASERGDLAEISL